MGSLSGIPAVRVDITANDQTSPAFAAARASAVNFQQSLGTMGNTADYEMSKARHAVRGLGEEIGVKMPRFVSSFLVSMNSVGSIMAAAFSGIAVVGLVEVLTQAADRFSKMAADALIYTDAMKAAYAEITKSNAEMARLADHIKEVAKETELVGLTGSTRTGVSLQQKGQEIEDTRAQIRAAADNLYGLEHGFLGVSGNAEHLKNQLATLREKERDLLGEQTKLNAELRDQIIKEQADAAEKAARAVASWAEKLRDVTTELAKLPLTRMGQAGFPGLSPSNQETFPLGWAAGIANGPTAMPLYSGSKNAMELYKIQTDQNAAIAAAAQVYEQTATATQIYSDKVATLTELLNKIDPATGKGRISMEQFALGVQHAADEMDKSNKVWQQFGAEVGQTLEAAMLFGRSWSDALKTVLVELIQVIAKMYILKGLQSSGGGGFLASFFGGLFGGGKAGGGPVYAGLPYLVGEQGPELFVPGGSGTIIPSGAATGNVVYQDFRGAVVSDDLLRKAEGLRMMSVTEERAVARSVMTVREMRLRQ